MTIDQARLDTLLDAMSEEPFKDLRFPALARLAQHTVIGDLVLEAIAEEPEIIQAQRHNPDQLALATTSSKNKRSISLMMITGSTETLPLFA